MGEIKICRNCGNEFKPKRITQVFCDDCRTGYDTCPVCGKKKKKLNKFCSNSCQAKYYSSLPGYVNPGSKPEVKEKIKETFVKKYGATSPWLSSEFRSKYEADQLSKRGYAYPFQSDGIQSKVKSTNQKNLGVNYPMESSVILDKAKKTLISNYGGPSPMYSKEVQDLAKSTLFERYGDYYCLESQKLLKGRDSKPNLEFKSLLEKADISYEREVRVCGKAFDFRVDNTLIEINPTATHNTIFKIFGKRKIGSDYHLNKTLLANSQGLRCIHVWDWDNKDLIISLLGQKDKIYARDCDVADISKDQADEFLSKYHLQGPIKAEVSLGLFFKGKLVGLMTFGKPRYNTNFSFELLRLCYSCNVLGGSNKLFNYFIEKYKPNNLVSYCDRSKFSGEVYSRLGFNLKRKGKPSRHWYNIRTGKHITDNLLRQRGADQLLGTNYGKGTNNEEIMLNSGFVTVYDCGQDTWVWKSQS